MKLTGKQDDWEWNLFFYGFGYAFMRLLAREFLQRGDETEAFSRVVAPIIGFEVARSVLERLEFQKFK